MTAIKLGLLGASGKMGQAVSELIKKEFSEKISLSHSTSQGEPMAPLLDTDVVIDFSTPSAMAELAKQAYVQAGAGKKIPCFVIGSTGWKIDDRREVETLSEKAPMVMSSNFSTGVAALLEVLKFANPLLEKLKYTPVIVESHHRTKKDSPSGTAVSLQRVIAPMGPGNVQTHSVRAGETIGNHEITFHGKYDHITLGHFAQDRAIFARGALEVALWLTQKRAASPELTGTLGMDAFFKENYL